MVFEPRPDDFALERVWPKSGSLLLDDKKMSPDFSIRYGYRGGSYLGSKNYVISLKAGRNGEISSGEKTASFPVTKEKLEEIFLMLVQQKFFDSEPPMVVRLRQQLPSLFGIGGAHVTLQAQADRNICELPPLPLKVRESNIDYGHILRIEHTRVEGLPTDVTMEKLEQAVAEAKALTAVFDAIRALVPESAFEEVGPPENTPPPTSQLIAEAMAAKLTAAGYTFATKDKSDDIAKAKVIGAFLTNIIRHKVSVASDSDGVSVYIVAINDASRFDAVKNDVEMQVKHLAEVSTTSRYQFVTLADKNVVVYLTCNVAAETETQKIAQVLEALTK